MNTVDNDVRRVALDFLEGNASMDELEDAALDAAAESVDLSWEASELLHLVATRRDLTDEEFRSALIAVAATVDASARGRSTASMGTTIVEKMSFVNVVIRRAISWVDAGRSGVGASG